MLTFREFLNRRITYYTDHFHTNSVLLDYNGDQLRQLNLSFQNLTDQYFVQLEQQELRKQNEAAEKLNGGIQNDSKLFQQKAKSPGSINPHQSLSIPNMHSLKINEDELNLRLNDKDLEEFWAAIKPSYELGLNLEGQNISDQSLLRLSELYQDGICRFTKLKLKGNTKITQVGALKLGQALRENQCVQVIDLNGLTIGTNGVNRIIELIPITKIRWLDLGLITNESLIYLSKNLDSIHNLSHIAFGQNSNYTSICNPYCIDIQGWQQSGKNQFQSIIRHSQPNRSILSINLYPSKPIDHYSLISQLNLITKKNRKLKVMQQQDDFKAASLNPNHQEYYDPDNHNLNAYKFSVKSYLTNVFGSLLDEALYFLQKERRNQLRDQATFDITKEPINKQILQDICTSDGSIIVLTKYLLSKIKQKEIEAAKEQQAKQQQYIYMIILNLVSEQQQQ